MSTTSPFSAMTDDARPGFVPNDPFNAMRSDLSSADRVAAAAHRDSSRRASADVLAKLASLDLRSAYDRGVGRALMGQVPTSDSEAQAIAREVMAEIDEHVAGADVDTTPPTAVWRPRADEPRSLTPAELELLRRLPAQPADLSDGDVDLLLDLDAAVEGTDRELVTRVLGDAAERRFERQKAGYVAAVKASEPAPVGSHSATRKRLERLIADRLASEAPDLVASVAAAAPEMRRRAELMAEGEARSRAAEAVASGVSSAVEAWRARVASAEAMSMPARPGSSSSGLERGRRMAERDRRRSGHGAEDPFARLRGEGANPGGRPVVPPAHTARPS